MKNDVIRIKEEIINKIEVSEEVFLLRMNKIGRGAQIIVKILSLLSENGVMINTFYKQVYCNNQASFSATCGHEYAELLESEKFKNDIRDIIGTNNKLLMRRGLKEVHISGVGITTASGVVYRIRKALQNESINIYGMSTSEISLTVLIDAKDAMKTAIALDTAFNKNTDDGE